MSPIDILLDFSGSFAVSLTAKATAITALALITAWCARRQRAAVRHLMLASTFAILTALPVAALWAPSLPVEVTVERAAMTPLQVEAPTRAVTHPTGDDLGGIPVSVSRTVTTIAPAEWLAIAWLVGVVLFSLPVAVALHQVRSLRRSSIAWPEGQAMVDAIAAEIGERRHIDVRLSDEISGPLTNGVRQPAILLPADAPTWRAAELHRAIVHELEHVRRRDWLIHCGTRIVCAGYWFHPLVWATRRRLELEAERACDDAVLRWSEATDYADQLVALARRMSAASKPRPALAMASRADLATRVGAVLDNRQRRGRAGTWWIAAACALSALIISTISPLKLVAAQQPAVSAASAGTPTQAGEQFEVVSIKPCLTGEVMRPQGPGGGARTSGYGGGTFDTAPTTLTITCMTVQAMAYLAYVAAGNKLLNDPGRPNELRVKGGPEWAHKERWSIEAKTSHAVERRPMLSQALQALLADRFQLRVHRATEEEDMYGLVVAKGGLKIAPMPAGGCIDYVTATEEQRQRPGTFFCGLITRLGSNGRMSLTMGAATMERFAGVLGAFADRPVIDKTGVSDPFNIAITFVPMNAPPGISSGEPLVSVLDRQLGLKFETTRGPAEYIVIDAVQRPSTNTSTGER